MIEIEKYLCFNCNYISKIKICEKCNNNSIVIRCILTELKYFTVLDICTLASINEIELTKQIKDFINN